MPPLVPIRALLLAACLAPALWADERSFDPRAHAGDRIAIKVREDAPVERALDGTVATLRGWSIAREHSVPPAQLDAWRARGEERLGRALPDLGRHLIATLPEGLDPTAALELVRALPWVEYATPSPLPVRPPTASAPTLLNAPDFFPIQLYPNAAPQGFGVAAAWSVPGATGVDVRLCDVEFSWNATHTDLPNVQLVGPQPNDPFNDTNHGTAVLGIVGAQANAFGTIGITPTAELYFAAANTGAGAGTYSPGAAITRAMTVLRPGDILLIEQQIFGPDPGLGSGCGPGDPISNLPGVLPIEWHQPWYDAIQLAVANGIVVVEAAGNGQTNLDDPALQIGHAPFALQNDSGAIMVGAGHGPNSTDVAGSRPCFSNYGATVDLQAWGGQVVTTGFGGLYATGGADHFYTSTFSGTSSASALIAGLCAAVQGAARATSGAPLEPSQVLEVLATRALPQTSGAFPASQNVGPRPDLGAALLPDLDGNGVPDAIDIVRGAVDDCDGDGVPDAAQVALGLGTDLDGDGVLDVCAPPPLYADLFELSVASGGVQQLALDAPLDRAGRLYVVLGSASGSSPATVDPLSGLSIPLVLDVYTSFLVQNLGGGIVGPFYGVLDGAGDASVSFTVPQATDPTFAGLELHHAFITIDAFGTGLIDFASNAVPIALVP
ncbi:Intracellular serine protease [Planctomycetes bacterium Pla163]|uniref:Intracellular serine protease n=1 Tax=Rohdeia mirabilis TaxID=2528008 RepID=A0A518CXI9_9BACT|nr:Intracellular serine protease [Planctomycetes bacterium Pla163]